MTVEEHGRSDRTQLALLATKLGPAWARRARPLLQRGEVGVLHGLGGGLRFPARAVAPDHAHARLLMLGQLELPVQEALRRTVPPGGTVYDVGANVGFFALLAARLTGEGGRVVAFEPVPGMAALIEEAAARSDLAGRVQARAQAVAAHSGTEALHVVAEGSWSHLASRGAHAGTAQTVDVEVVTLDDAIAAGAPAPDVIKLDVEGSEVDVLAGASRLLETRRPAVICETHGTNAEVCDLLEAAGYTVEHLDGTAPPREAGAAHLLARC